MPTFTTSPQWRTSVLPRGLGFEELASGLPRENSHERTECVVTARLHRRRRVVTSDSRKTSSSLASFGSSFGHDNACPSSTAIRDSWRSLWQCTGGTECGFERAELAVRAEGVFG